MAKKESKVKKTLKNIVKDNTKYKAIKVAVLAISLFLINAYVILNILHREGGFTITLDGQEGKKNNLIIYESPDDKTEKSYLKCGDIDFISHSSIDWIPKDIDDEADGSHHSGLGYIAYTFYAENVGEETINYWITTEIDEMELDVDEALRFVLYRNGERTVYAKQAKNGNPEPGTEPFKDEDTIMLENVSEFKPGDVDKYTFVVFMEGDDPQCVDNLLEGFISMHMTLTEEQISNQDEN